MKERVVIVDEHPLAGKLTALLSLEQFPLPHSSTSATAGTSIWLRDAAL
jgi:hypothetical protein